MNLCFWRKDSSAGLIELQKVMGLLKGIPSNLSPELLYALAKMGHGDEIVLGDANFPSR